MSFRKLTAAETDALLTELANRACTNGCKCIFCRTFNEGRESGMHDTIIEFERALGDVRRRIAA